MKTKKTTTTKTVSTKKPKAKRYSSTTNWKLHYDNLRTYLSNTLALHEKEKQEWSETLSARNIEILEKIRKIEDCKSESQKLKKRIKLLEVATSVQEAFINGICDENKLEKINTTLDNIINSQYLDER